jgi:hypothetical protein
MQVSYLPFCTLNRHFGGVPPLRGLVVDGELFGSFGLYVGRKAVVLRVLWIQWVYFLIFFGGSQKTASGKKDPYLPITNTLSPAFEFARSAARLFGGAPRHHEYNHACPARQGEIDKIFNPAIS